MSGGDGTPIVKYNAKAAKWKVDDVTLHGISFVVDLDNAKAGWALFRENTEPDFAMVPVVDLVGGSPYPARPSEDHRKGFLAMVKIPDRLAAGKPSVREFASCSLAVRRAFDVLYDAWALERGHHPGQLPAVTIKDYEEISGRHGSNFAPIFRIVKWVDRPESLDGVAVASAPIDAADDDADFDDEIPF
ncbi:MAG: hypothetical protein ACREJ5_04325 [Geminicoccaceae bacterium]